MRTEKAVPLVASISIRAARGGVVAAGARVSKSEAVDEASAAAAGGGSEVSEGAVVESAGAVSWVGARSPATVGDGETGRAAVPSLRRPVR